MGVAPQFAALAVCRPPDTLAAGTRGDVKDVVRSRAGREPRRRDQRDGLSRALTSACAGIRAERRAPDAGARFVDGCYEARCVGACRKRSVALEPEADPMGHTLFDIQGVQPRTRSLWVIKEPK